MMVIIILRMILRFLDIFFLIFFGFLDFLKRLGRSGWAMSSGWAISSGWAMPSDWVRPSSSGGNSGA